MPVSLPVIPLEGFEERLREQGKTVVLFAADWCGYCRRFEPEFVAAASASKGAVRFAHADISDDDTDPRWDTYGIRAVPTVIVFEGGKPVARADAILGRGIPPPQWAALLREHAG